MVDALQYDTHKDAAADAMKFFGHVDVVVLNSGRSQRAWIVDTELAVDKALWEWNLLGSVSLAKAILPHMIGRREGHIVVTSSIAGKIGVLCMLCLKQSTNNFYILFFRRWHYYKINYLNLLYLHFLLQKLRLFSIIQCSKIRFAGSCCLKIEQLYM